MQPKSSTSTSSTTTNQICHVPVERFKEVCLRVGGEFSKDTNAILDFLFNPEKELNIFNCEIETLKHYLTGGHSFESFKNKLKSYDNSSVCGLVWNINYVAYRCRTCALSPCMSICAECFKNGDHQGHDYNMFRSGAGGACDCGDEYVMNQKGFCKSHGCNKQLTKSQPPNDLIKCCEIILSHLLYRLLQYFRSVYSSLNFRIPSNRNQMNTILSDVNPFIDLLNDLCSIGTPLKKIFVDYLISEDFYSKKIQSESYKCVNIISEEELNNPKTTKTQNLSYQHEIYLKGLKSLETIKLPDLFKNKQDEMCKLEYKNMVDEFLFWCVIFEFPENLVKFLLSLLPDIRYKMIFIKSFVSHYSYISVLLLNSKSEHLSSRVVHISVQLFSNEAIAMKALEEFNLLPIILSTLHNMIVNSQLYNQTNNNSPDQEGTNDCLLIKNKLENESTNLHLVVDPDHPILQENLYWLVISDFVNLLTHRNFALKFLSNHEWVKLWFELVEYFQSMNLNIRKFGEHALQEQPTYFSSFSAELEFCSSIMWSLIQHLKSSEEINLSEQLIKLVLESLKNWLVKIGLMDMTEFKIKRPNYVHLSFHIPLHRYLSTILYNSLFNQSASLKSLLDSYFIEYDSNYKQNLLANILAYPLQLQIGFNEIHGNMWVRNGMQMRGQAMTYVQNHFCSSFSDSDLFLIQVLASELDPNLFMNLYFERFHLVKWLKDSILNRHNNLEEKKDIKAESSVSPDTVTTLVEEMLDEFSDESNPPNNSSSNQQPSDPDNLESSHQTSMLIGSLTTLAQILMIKPNLRLKSYLLTRNEIVYLLSVSDRTYSQLEESLPDICSLSSAKRFIEPVLSDVSDYLQPSLDALSIGSLKQGRYKPKDSVWLTEYDPLYVMLRSVKRREFQESFDRYCQFVERKMMQVNSNNAKVKKNLWPPFRIPDRINKHLESLKSLHDNLNLNDNYDLLNEIENEQRLDIELVNKWNLLNTKILHSILLNILFEHYYVSTVSEKILYFVIYLLELGVYAEKYLNSNKISTDDEEKCNEQPEFDELNPETWFKSKKLSDNLCTFVTFTKSELNTEFTSTKRSQSPNSEKKTKLQETTSSQELNSLDQSTVIAQIAPPLKRMCSGIFSEQPREQTGDAESLESSIESEKRSKFKKVHIHESILSLLVKIVYKNKNLNETKENITNLNQPFEFEFLKSKSDLNKNDDLMSFSNTRIGDESDFILNLLEKSSELNDKCRLNIEKALDTLNLINKKTSIIVSNNEISSSPKTSQDVNISPKIDDDLVNKKLKAKARQQKLLAQMSSSQKAFLLNPENKTDIEAYQEIAPSDSKISVIKSIDSEQIASKIDNNEKSTELCHEEQKEPIVQEEYDCCICRLSSVATPHRPIGVVALLQSTSVLGFRESSKIENPTKKLPLSDNINYKQLVSETTCAKQEQKRIKNMTEAFGQDSCKYSVNIGWQGGIYVQMCGHYLHFDCYSSYKQTLDEQTNFSVRSASSEYPCPLCRQISNCILPISPTTPVKKLENIADKPTSSSVQFPKLTTNISNAPAKIWILSSLVGKTCSSKSSDIQEDMQRQAIESNIYTDQIYEKVLSLLKSRPTCSPEISSKILTVCKNEALTVITSSTPIEYRYIDHSLSLSSSTYTHRSPADDDITLFTTSVLRTQLEIDLMLLSKQQMHQQKILNMQSANENYFIANTFNFKKKKSCFLPLFDVISTHCRLICSETKPHAKQWLLLVNPALSNDVNRFLFKIGVKSNIDNTLNDLDDSNQEENNNFNNLNNQQQTVIKNKLLSSLSKLDNVPNLLKDPIAILLLMIVNLPVNFERYIFNCVVSNVFNLVFIQSIIDLLREFDDEEKQIWSNKNDQNGSIFKDYLSHIICYLNNTSLLKKKGPKNNTSDFYMKTIWTVESAKNYVETKCLHYLKIASLLQSYLYDQEASLNQMNSFDSIIKYLNINQNQSHNFSLKWALTKPNEILDFWLNELIKANDVYAEQVDNLLSLSFGNYHFPQLLDLPNLYSELFSYYLHKKCEFCSKVPKETAICLLCGAQLCYKTNYCCDSMKDFNKRHLNSCGAGTLILLNINSTYIFIIRGKRCAPWASLYLDEHGEEDKDLRRGKPLYLNEQRFNLLKSSWHSHTFDYQSLKWYNTSYIMY